MTGWRVCPDCGWDFDKHGDTHKWRFHCKRGERETVGIGQYPPTESSHAIPPLSEVDADAMMSWVTGMMDELSITQPEALDLYIKEVHNEKASPLVSPGTANDVGSTALVGSLDPDPGQPDQS